MLRLLSYVTQRARYATPRCYACMLSVLICVLMLTVTATFSCVACDIAACRQHDMFSFFDMRAALRRTLLFRY